MTPRRLVVGITGASGTIYGVRLLEIMRGIPGWETHLVISRAAARTLALESPEWTLAAVKELAGAVHDPADLAAPIASGSFLTEGMIVAPCSMKSLASIAHGYSADLLGRAADVTLKERRRLVLIPRETPLHLGHLRNMVAVTEMGGILAPPLVALYHQPRTVLEVVDHSLGKVLDLFAIPHQLFRRWEGPSGLEPRSEEAGL